MSRMTSLSAFESCCFFIAPVVCIPLARGENKERQAGMQAGRRASKGEKICIAFHNLLPPALTVDGC